MARLSDSPPPPNPGGVCPRCCSYLTRSWLATATATASRPSFMPPSAQLSVSLLYGGNEESPKVDQTVMRDVLPNRLWKSEEHTDAQRLLYRKRVGYNKLRTCSFVGYLSPAELVSLELCEQRRVLFKVEGGRIARGDLKIVSSKRWLGNCQDFKLSI